MQSDPGPTEVASGIICLYWLFGEIYDMLGLGWSDEYAFCLQAFGSLRALGFWPIAMRMLSMLRCH